MLATTPSNIPGHSPPYDVVYRIADMLSTGSEPDFVVLTKHLPNYALVNRLFAAVFQPRIFHTTIIRDVSRLPKMFSILSSNPSLGNHIKHLTLVMRAGSENDALLVALLDLITSVGIVALTSHGRSESDTVRPSWGSFTEAFRRSVTRLCDLPTVKVLKVGDIDFVPATLFLDKKHLAEIVFSGCNPVFDSESLPVADSGTGRLPPVSFSVAGIEFQGGEAGDMIHFHRGFFSRVRRLEIGTSMWRKAQHMSFIAIISSLAPLSQIDRLNVTVDQGMDEDAIALMLGGGNRFLPIRGLTNLKELRLAHIFRKRDFLSFWKLGDFFESVESLIESFHSSRLGRLVISFVDLDDDSLDDVCRSHGGKWGSLEKILIRKISDGSLRRLNAVVACMEIDRTEHDQNLEFARECVREATIMSGIGPTRRRIVMKSRLGAIMYEN